MAWRYESSIFPSALLNYDVRGLLTFESVDKICKWEINGRFYTRDT